MLSLADTQAAFRRAVTGGASEGVLPLLNAPRSAAARLAIYQRHHRESLVRHLRGRFPTVEWLIGSPRMTALAEAFIRIGPPSAPYMAEYGEGFTVFLASAPIKAQPSYLADVARLDWHLGTVAVAVDEPALAITALQDHPQTELPGLAVRLQPGVRYLASDWPVDELVNIRLGAEPPDRLPFAASATALEVRGARGRFSLARLDTPSLRFRSSLAAGLTLAEAAESALDTDAGFDIAAGLAGLFTQGLVVSILTPQQANHHV